MVFFGMRTKKSAGERAKSAAISSVQNQTLLRIARAQHLGQAFTPVTIEDAYGRAGLRAGVALARAGLVTWGADIRVTAAGRARVGPLGRRPAGPLEASLRLGALRKAMPLSPKQRKLSDRRQEKTQLDAWFAAANKPVAPSARAAVPGGDDAPINGAVEAAPSAQPATVAATPGAAGAR